LSSAHHLASRFPSPSFVPQPHSIPSHLTLLISYIHICVRHSIRFDTNHQFTWPTPTGAEWGFSDPGQGLLFAISMPSRRISGVLRVVICTECGCDVSQ
jgi:hypothetical protein